MFVERDASPLKAVPAYYARSPMGWSVPFIVSLLLYDGQHRPRIPPAVEQSINRTVEITGREGLAQAIIADDDDPAIARQFMERAARLKPQAIVLFRCQSPETAERLMQYLHSAYSLSLVQEQVKGEHHEQG